VLLHVERSSEQPECAGEVVNGGDAGAKSLESFGRVEICGGRHVKRSE